MYLDHDFMKLETKQKRLARTMNIFVANLWDHRQDHQLLHLLYGSIKEVVVLVHIGETEQAKVDFHPQCHHQKKNPE